MSKCLYKLNLFGREYTGTVDEISVLSGYSIASVGMIARGEINCRKGIEIECIGREAPKSETAKNDSRLMAEWDKIVARFRKVEWVSEMGDKVIKLEVRRK